MKLVVLFMAAVMAGALLSALVGCGGNGDDYPVEQVTKEAK